MGTVANTTTSTGEGGSNDEVLVVVSSVEEVIILVTIQDSILKGAMESGKYKCIISHAKCGRSVYGLEYKTIKGRLVCPSKRLLK